MLREMQEIQSLATKYSKAELGRMVQMGMLDPQKAMMAGMMIQRIEQQNAQPPQTTVAQEVLGLPAVNPQAAQPQMAQAPQGVATLPQQPQPSAGIENLPTGDVGNYAGGGIVAFGSGGDVPEFEKRDFFPRLGRAYADVMTLPSRAYLGDMLGIASTLRDYGAPVPDTSGVFSPDLFDSLTPFSDRYAAQRQAEARAAAAQKEYPAEKWATVSKGVQTPQDAAGAGRVAPELSRVAEQRQGAGAAFPKLVPIRSDAGKFDPNKYKIEGAEIPVPKERAREDIAKARKEAEAAEGVDAEMYNKMIAAAEGKKGELSKRKDVAGGEALMQFGLGLMGARKGQEFQAASKAGAEALSAYKQDVKDLRAAEDKYNERIDNLRISDQQARQTGARSDIAQAEKDRELAAAARVEQAKAKNELAKTSAQISATTYAAELSARTQKEIANLGAETQRWIHSQPPQIIQAIDAIAKRENVPFTEAMNRYANLQAGGRNAFTDEEIYKQAMKNLNDAGIFKPTQQQVQQESTSIRNTYNAIRGGGGGAGGTLQQGANGTFNYVPSR